MEPNELLAYEQSPSYSFPPGLQLPEQNFVDLQWTSFPAGEANQFQILTKPADEVIEKPIVDANRELVGTVTEANILPTNVDAFDQLLNGNFLPFDQDRVQILNTISTEDHPITPYTYSPATVPFDTGPTPHVHWFDAEWFYVIEGQLDLWFGDPGAYAPGEIPGVNAPLEDTYHYVSLSAGQIVYTPAGTLHSFRNPNQERATMASIWYRQPNPADPTVPVPEGGIEQFFTHPQIGLQLDSPDASEAFISTLSEDQTQARIDNWAALFPEYSVTISSGFGAYLMEDGNGDGNNPDDPNPNGSVVFEYDPALLGGEIELLNSLWVNTPAIRPPNPAENSIIGDQQNNNLVGTAVNDNILGLLGNDTLNGLEGDDNIYGGQGDDLIVDDRGGNDNLYGDHGNDSVSGGLGEDFIFGDTGDDSLSGQAGNDTILGGDGADIINGNSGNDLISGGNRDDLIDGGMGDDTIRGGAGRDRFVLTTGAGTDEIADFEPGSDFFSLVNLTFDQLSIIASDRAVQIEIASTGEVLATVTGVSQLMSDDFL
ncbi:MAG: cupin domain-containing protein [Microcoleaceae cyanobacterium]